MKITKTMKNLKKCSQDLNNSLNKNKIKIKNKNNLWWKWIKPSPFSNLIFKKKVKWLKNYKKKWQNCKNHQVENMLLTLMKKRNKNIQYKVKLFLHIWSDKWCQVKWWETNNKKNNSLKESQVLLANLLQKKSHNLNLKNKNLMTTIFNKCTCLDLHL